MQLFLTILRAVFILVMAAVGWNFVVDSSKPLENYTWLSMAIALIAGVLVLCIDILAPGRRKLALFAGTFFGLIVGVIAGYALNFVVELIFTQLTANDTTYDAEQRKSMMSFLQLLTYCVTTYFSISFVFQTKDDFRFIIPYVEFRKQTRGSRPIVVDTSALIDGRIIGIVQSGMFESQLIIPRFILNELQTVADSGDKLKRNRGRRGLDILARLHEQKKIVIITYDTVQSPNESVDQQLMRLASELEARILTTDFNLEKVAQLSGQDVININHLASSMKPEALPGEQLSVRIIKPGEGNNQGVGYMDDGTMVVIEQGRTHLNQEVEFIITNTVQTNAGKMIFGRLADGVARGKE